MDARRFQAHPSRGAYRAPYREPRTRWLRLAGLWAVEFAVMAVLFLCIPAVLYVLSEAWW